MLRIRQSIGWAPANQSRAIRLPVHVAQGEHRLARTRSELVVRLGREPTVEEVAAAAGVKLEDAIALKRRRA